MRVVPPAQEIDIRIAAWGFYAALKSMAVKNEFFVNDYELHGTAQQSVATTQSMTSLGVQRRGSERLDQMIPSLTDADKIFDIATKLNPPGSGNITGTFPDDAFEGDYWYRTGGRPLSFSEVLVALTSGLKTLAAVPITSMMDENIFNRNGKFRC